MKSTTQSHSYLSTLLLTFFIICFIPRHCHASPLVNNGQLMLRLADEQLNFVAQSALQELMQLVNTLKQARDRPLAYLQQQHNKLLSLQRFHLQALPTLPPLPALPALHTLPPLNALQSLTSLQNSFPALSGLFGLSTLDLGRAKPLLSYVDQLPPLMLQAKSTVTTGVPVDPDLRATAPEMITSRGFDVEFHQVTTEDCYVLTLHRIVHPNLSENERRRPILLQHGLMGTSADYLMNSGGGHIDDNDSRSLAFYLAKLGYDVWLANSRGSTYSVNHTQFDPNKEKKFWQFSFDEMSKFELPATIATIQNKTGHGECQLYCRQSCQSNFNQNFFVLCRHSGLCRPFTRNLDHVSTAGHTTRTVQGGAAIRRTGADLSSESRQNAGQVFGQCKSIASILSQKLRLISQPEEQSVFVSLHRSVLSRSAGLLLQERSVHAGRLRPAAIELDSTSGLFEQLPGRHLHTQHSPLRPSAARSKSSLVQLRKCARQFQLLWQWTTAGNWFA